MCFVCVCVVVTVHLHISACVFVRASARVCECNVHSVNLVCNWLGMCVCEWVCVCALLGHGLELYTRELMRTYMPVCVDMCTTCVLTVLRGLRRMNFTCAHWTLFGSARLFFTRMF